MLRENLLQKNNDLTDKEHANGTPKPRKAGKEALRSGRGGARFEGVRTKKERKTKQTTTTKGRIYVGKCN